MTARRVFGFCALMSVLALPAYAGGKADLQKYFSDAATKAKAAANAADKRRILDDSFRIVSKALDVAEGLPIIPQEDVAAMRRFHSALQEKQDELVGAKGFTRVPDAQLNAFCNYVVQDMEQADQVITISLVTLLIIVVVILILV